MNKVKIKKNDKVVVIAGKDKAKTGKVISVSPKAGTVTVDGINIHKKHKKGRSAQDVSGIIDKIAPIDASNVMVVCPSCDKPSRVTFKTDEATGKKVRVCKKCGSVLDKGKEVKEVKASQKKTAKKKTEAGADAPKAEVKKAPRKTVKKKETESAE